VYQQQEQEQEQQEQEQEQEQDAENPFLDPPFSRIKSTFSTSRIPLAYKALCVTYHYVK
jgi:hypothetical protein